MQGSSGFWLWARAVDLTADMRASRLGRDRRGQTVYRCSGGALAGDYPNPTIATGTRGVALGGATSSGDGTNLVATVWFNRLGGIPTITHPSTGYYLVTFPGLPINVASNAIAVSDGPNDRTVAVSSLPAHFSSMSSTTLGRSSTITSRSSSSADPRPVNQYDRDSPASARGFSTTRSTWVSNAWRGGYEELTSLEASGRIQRLEV